MPAAKPAYRFEFRPDELDAIAACNAAHGFAVVRGMIGADLAERMRADALRVAPAGGLAPGASIYHTSFIEIAPSLLELLDLPAYMRLQERMLGTADLVVHRSATIVRAPGSPGMAWHTDMPAWESPPTSANAVLNSGEWPNAMAFYLSGCHPDRGGLAIIPDSHAPDWTPPAGFALGPQRQFLQRVGDDAPYLGMDVPGAVRLETGPTDLIVFAARTYHGVAAHRGDQPRPSAGFVCRPRSVRLRAPWPLGERARRFLAGVPQRLQRYFDGYVGIEDGWRPAA